MLHIMTRSIAFGMGRSVYAMLGAFSAVLCLLSASAAGLTALLVALPGLFMALKLAGAAYLVWLGYRAWGAPVGETDDPDAAPESAPPAPLALFGRAFSVGISNPKALVFAAAFLPLFLDPSRPKGGQFAVMVATFAVIEFGWYFAYALGGRGLAQWLRRPSRRRLFNRVTGAVFVGFGLVIAGSRA